jgi:hypothetical protein
MRQPSAAPKSKPVKKGESSIGMKTLSLITVGVFVLFGVAVSSGATDTGSTRVLNRISTETGVDMNTIQTEKASSGLGYGGLENANLIANASGETFDTIVGQFKAGEGWGKIAQDYGYKLGTLVSAAHRSSNATLHARNTATVHGKSSTTHGKSTSIHGRSAHSQNTHRMSGTAFGRSHAGTMGRSSFGFSSRGGFHGMSGMGHGGHGGR